jgi:hypothetical protein
MTISRILLHISCFIASSNLLNTFPSFADTLPCKEFHFPDSDFASVERDHRPSLLYVWVGQNRDEHGVAFLIDASAGYYLTARHVVLDNINDSTQTISVIAVGSSQKLTLSVLAHDEKLDVALLKVSGPPADHSQAPYELFLSNPAPLDATFSGMAFTNASEVRPTQPKENRLSLSDDGQEMELRVSTDFGDSGAPVYTKQGLVVGIVTGKKRLSDAIIIPIRNVSKFLSDHSMDLPHTSGAWKLHDDILLSTNINNLRSELTPAHLPDRPSNFEFLSAIETILHKEELGRIDPNIVDCPVVQAAHDRGLQDAAFELVKLDAPFEAQEGAQRGTTPLPVTPPGNQCAKSLQACRGNR